MEIRILGCNGSRGKELKPTAFLVDGKLLIDAGTASEVLDDKERAKIDHILITHSHIDHTGDLPFLAESAFDMRMKPIFVHSIKEAIEAISSNIFNWRIWPNFAEIPNRKGSKLSYKILKPLKKIKVGSYFVTPIPVNHTVPTVGYLIDNGKTAFSFIGDTYCTDLIWREIRKNKRLRAVFIESSFPNRLEKDAKLTGHLTPELLYNEISKLGMENIQIYVTHLKPLYRDEIISELKGLSKKLPLKILEDGMKIKI